MTGIMIDDSIGDGAENDGVVKICSQYPYL